jgi:DNA-binding NtrC family response regulator
MRPPGLDGFVMSAAEAPPELAEVLAEQEAAWIDLEQEQRIIGQDPGFLGVLENAHKVAGYDVSVLIREETGPARSLSPASSTREATVIGPLSLRSIANRWCRKSRRICPRTG